MRNKILVLLLLFITVVASGCTTSEDNLTTNFLEIGTYHNDSFLKESSVLDFNVYIDINSTGDIGNYYYTVELVDVDYFEVLTRCGSYSSGYENIESIPVSSDILEPVKLNIEECTDNLEITASDGVSDFFIVLTNIDLTKNYSDYSKN